MRWHFGENFHHLMGSLPCPGVEVLLNQLCDWGKLESHLDMADVATVEDFLKRRSLFQISAQGEAANELLLRMNARELRRAAART
jgi:Protein of unknown function (DUF2397)